MGLFDWLKQELLSAVSPSGPERLSRRNEKTRPELALATSVGDSSLIQLAGTTTNSKEAAVALVQRHQLTDRVALHVTGTLQREPENPYEPGAVAVLVEGERIGYLPSYAAKVMSLELGSSAAVPLQLFYADLGTCVRVEAFVWLGDDHPQWQYSTENPPAMSSEQKRMKAQSSSSAMVHDALAQGGVRAEQFKAGIVNGVHYVELIEPIKQLKREGKLEEALVLSYAAIEGAENGRDGREPAPWYTEQAAIIHRKLGQRAQEVAVLVRWLQFVSADERNQTYLGERLSKITR